MPSHSMPVLECPKGSEYDEQTFQYFLAVELRRAARAGRPLQVLLAAIEPTPGLPVPFPKANAMRVFDGLRAATRETDVIGWYRQGHVAGVVLTPRQEALVRGSEPFARRVEQGLRRRLPESLGRSLRVRVVNHETPTTEEGSAM